MNAAISGRHFADEAGERIAEARRPSTVDVYEGKWKVFVGWCEAHALLPTELSPPQLANVFMWPFNIKGFAPSTIKGYGSMIADTYRHLGRPDPGQDRVLSTLMAKLRQEKTGSEIPGPQRKWNLLYELSWLASERLELLDRAPLKEVSLQHASSSP